MRAHQPTAVAHGRAPTGGIRIRPLDSYGSVLLLVILDYLAVSTATGATWNKVITVALLSTTLLFALRTSQAGRIWQSLAVAYLLASTALTLVSSVVSPRSELSQLISIIGGTLLLVTPLAILRRISTHTVVTNETVLGAVCVYLLLGFSFAFIYQAIGFSGPAPFFAGQTYATTNNYLFFSYTTLTTVGYGNLVPAGSVGQTFAMLEALSGQIYLVIVVARLVSLWGQARSRGEPRNAQEAGEDSMRTADGWRPSVGGDTPDRLPQ